MVDSTLPESLSHASKYPLIMKSASVFLVQRSNNLKDLRIRVELFCFRLGKNIVEQQGHKMRIHEATNWKTRAQSILIFFRGKAEIQHVLPEKVCGSNSLLSNVQNNNVTGYNLY